MSLANKQFQIYNQAMDLKKEIEQHNANVKKLSFLHTKLNKDSGQKFNFDSLRLQSDKDKLENIKVLQSLQMAAIEEQKQVNNKLEHEIKNFEDDNMKHLNLLNEKITDRNQIIQINQHAYLKKDLYTQLLVSFLGVIVGILLLSVMRNLGALSRETYIILLVLGLIGYLIYVLYTLIKVRYFRDPDFSIYRHAIDPNISVADCPPCNGDIDGIVGMDGYSLGKGSNRVCPGMKQ